MRVDRIIVLSILIALTQGFLLVIDPTSGPFSHLVSKDYQLPLTIVLLAALVAITAGIADATVRSHPQIYLLKLPVARIRGQRFEFAPFSWILPSLLVVGTYLFLRLFDSAPIQVIGTIISALVLLVVIMAQYYTVGRQERLYGWANIGLNLATYIAGFLIFSAIYVNKWRALQSAPLVGIVTFLLTYELLRQSKTNNRRLLLYSIGAGLILGEVTWALNYWLLPVLIGGVMLLLIFYVVVGLMQAYLTNNLNRAVVREYLIVSLISLVLIVISILSNPQLTS
ncbi:MAG TPA: hypothetical protein VH186_14535 [Chloroflexia bacterium]|nr:hypothetical protein [Chloroflexia bacterium]